MINSARLSGARPANLAGAPVANKKISREFKLTAWITLLHLPLGVVLYNIGPFAIIHPIAVFILGLRLAVRTRARLEHVALAACYLVGAEVLWRMAKIPVFWEFGKYGSALILAVALIRRRNYTIPKLPFFYFAALLPSCVIALIDVDPSRARDQISFNMSGPFFLLVSCWYFSYIKVTLPQLRRILFALIIPLLSVASVTLFYTAAAENIQFNTESNFATSGGFGPNQVSSMLGLGVFVSAACFLVFKNQRKVKVVLVVMTLLFATQCLLTFSRGGIYNAVGAIIALLIFQFRNVSTGLRRLLPILVLAGLFLWFVFPVLNNFTDGKLEERFEETGTTHRAEIVESDFQIFMENPIFGIGVGAANRYRERFLEFSAASHTEFSRLISEHGMFGIFALLSLAVFTILNIKRQRSIQGRALVAGISVWCVLFMLNAGMRLAAPSLLWGMTFITIVDRRTAKPRFKAPVVI